MANPSDLYNQMRSKWAARRVQSGKTPVNGRPMLSANPLQPAQGAVNSAVQTNNIKPLANPGTNYNDELQNKVNAMYDTQQQSRLNEFYAARDKGVADVTRQLGEQQAEYADKKNQTDVVAAQNARRLQEQMAARGLAGSGENVTAGIAQSNARQGALALLNQQQAKGADELNRRIADYNDPMQETKIKNDIAAERANALYEAYLKGDELTFRDKQQARSEFESDRGFNYQKGRDDISDKRYTDETAYSRGRDKLSDERYTAETEYAHGRDKIADTRYADETKYNRNRDTISDKRYTDETKYNRNRDTIADKRYADETAYNRKITEREWAHMSPAERERMALQAKYSKSSGSPGGGSTKKKSTTSKPSAAAKEHTTAEKEFNKGKSTKGEARPTTYTQYASKMLRIEDPQLANWTAQERSKQQRKDAAKKKK